MVLEAAVLVRAGQRRGIAGASPSRRRPAVWNDLPTQAARTRRQTTEQRPRSVSCHSVGDTLRLRDYDGTGYGPAAKVRTQQFAV